MMIAYMVLQLALCTKYMKDIMMNNSSTFSNTWLLLLLHLYITRFNRKWFIDIWKTFYSLALLYTLRERRFRPWNGYMVKWMIMNDNKEQFSHRNLIHRSVAVDALGSRYNLLKPHKFLGALVSRHIGIWSTSSIDLTIPSWLYFLS